MKKLKSILVVNKECTDPALITPYLNEKNVVIFSVKEKSIMNETGIFLQKELKEKFTKTIRLDYSLTDALNAKDYNETLFSLGSLENAGAEIVILVCNSTFMPTLWRKLYFDKKISPPSFRIETDEYGIISLEEKTIRFIRKKEKFIYV